MIAAVKKKKAWVAAAIAVIIVLVSSLLFWHWHSTSDQTFESTTYAMGTYMQQTVTGANAQEAAKSASKNISNLEDKISWKIVDSDIARLNRSAGSGSISVDKKTAEILSLALDIANRSEGSYDPTIQPLSSLWDFDKDAKIVPAKDEIAKAVGLVGYKGLSVDSAAETAALSKVGMGIDLGGIGKGAACSAAIDTYRAAGVSSAIISAGGSSIGLFGTKANGTPWCIAVRDPQTPDSNAGTMGDLYLSSGYVSTSGIYEKYFRKNGVFYHHLLNPQTGYPQNNGLVSVTVVAENGPLSDGLSTACFVLGRKKSAALLEHYNAGAIFIDENNHVYVTKKLIGKFKITNQKYTLVSS